MKKGWKELAIGSIIENAPTSLEFKTGDWRILRPIFHKDKCINCYFCFIYCPDSAIIVNNGKVEGINLDYCKGCGICARQCPKNAIEMVREVELRKKEKD